MLKFRAVHLDDRAGITKENLRCSLHHACFSRPGGSEEQQIAYWAAGRVQSGAKHLVQVHQRLHSLLLPHDLRTQRRLEIQRVRAAFVGIKMENDVTHDRLLAPPPKRRRTAHSPASLVKLFELDLDGRLQE